MQDQIASVAYRLLNEGGLAAVSMRKIAQELGVQASALYWHFPNKQLILASLADRILAQEVVDSSPAEESTADVRAGKNSESIPNRVLQIISRFRQTLLSSRDGAEVVATSIAFELIAVPLTFQLESILRQAGLSDPEITGMTHALLFFTLGHTRSVQERESAIVYGAEVAGETNLSLVRKRSDAEFRQAILAMLSKLG